MLYTSYFANMYHMQHIHPTMVFVSIAGRAPNMYNGLQYKDLAPKYSWWIEWKDKYHSNPNSYESKIFYRDKYYETVLNKLNALDVMKHFMTFDDVCMLCYEKPTDFCHRHLVAEWLTKNGFFIEEFTY